MSVETITEQDFEKKTKTGKVLVDCYADWCGPCQMLSPVIDELAEETKGWKFYKLDIDEASGIAEEYGIMSIPTLLLFENGELKDTLIGLRTKGDLEKILRNIDK
ncbi:thioredoxin [Candidatus Saccharibacteria bacterium]|nr:thioredoxin [Candidatus Saccharibacteria bacterium]